MIVGTTYDRGEAEQGLRDWPDAGHVLMSRAADSSKWARVEGGSPQPSGERLLSGDELRKKLRGHLFGGGAS